MTIPKPQPSSEIHTTIEEFLLRRLRGETLTITQFITEHPGGSEELEIGLRQAELVAVANNASKSGAAFDPPAAAVGSSRGQLRIRCPHCQNLIMVDADVAWANVICDSCHDSFSLTHRCEGANVAPLSELGHFELLERVGVGAFGTVWRARDSKLGRIVALKIPRKGELSVREVALFMREASAEAQVLHPNVVRVYEVGRHRETLFIATEFIEGQTLADYVRDRQLGDAEIAHLVELIGRGLHAAHQAGVIHRDLKPGNILIDVHGQPHVTDFGLAKQQSSDVTMTLDGALIGTPAYMAPEQASGAGHDADARSDVYALGVILFQLLTGDLPFRGNATTMLKQVVHDEPPSPRQLNQQVPRDLETLCLKCLEKKPERRFATAGELADELKRFRLHRPILTRPIGRFGRLALWARRRPLVASLSVAVVVSLVLGILGSTLFALRSLAHAQRAEKSASRLSETVERLKSAAYAYDMAEVQRAVDAGSYENALLRLQKYGSKSIDSHRRGPAWFHWHRHIHRRQLAIWEGIARTRGIDVAPTQSRIAWGTADGALFVADERLRNVNMMQTHHPGEIRHVRFSPDGTRIYSLSEDGTFIDSVVETGLVDRSMTMMAGNATAFAVSHDGSALALAGTRVEPGCTELWRWTADDWQTIQKTQIADPLIRSLEFTEDDRTLIIGGDLRAYEVDAHTLDVLPHEMQCVSETSRVLPDNQIITQYSDRGTRYDIQLVDLNTAETLVTFQRPGAGEPTSGLSVSPDGATLAIPVGSRVIELYDTATGALRELLTGHRNRVTGAAFLGDSDRLVSTSDDGTVRVWDLREEAEHSSRRIMHTGATGSGWNESIRLSPMGDKLAIFLPQRIEVWSVPPTNVIRTLEYSSKPFQEVRHTGLAWAADNEGIAILLRHDDPDSTVHYWARDATEPTAVPVAPRLACFCFSASGNELLTGHSHADETWAWPGKPCHIRSIPLAAPGTQKIWQPSEETDIWQPHRMSISSMATSNDGKRVFSVSARDRSIKIWDGASGTLLRTLTRPNNIYGCSGPLAVTHDDQRIAVGWKDSLITLHDVTTDVLRLDDFRGLVGHDGRITDLAFTGDGRTLVSASVDGSVKIWDVAIGQIRTSLQGHDAAVRDVEVTPNGDWIFSMDVDGMLRCWDCRPLD